MEDRPADPLGEALDALEQGDPQEALRRLAACAPDDPSLPWAESLTLLELDDLAGARRALAEAERRLDADDPDLLWASAQLALREWRIGDARSALERLGERHETCQSLECLSLCLDLEHRFDDADRALQRACRLDPDGFPLPPRMSESEFDRIVQEALEGLPERFRYELEVVRVVVEPVPAQAVADPQDPAGTPPDLLGLFVGPTRLDMEDDASSMTLPPLIYLFQRNLERACQDEAELGEQVRITLYHEIGHFLGFDEEGVDAMGLA